MSVTPQEIELKNRIHIRAVKISCFHLAISRYLLFKNSLTLPAVPSQMHPGPSTSRSTKITVKKDLFFFYFRKLNHELGKGNFFSSVSFELEVAITADRVNDSKFVSVKFMTFT